MLYMQWCNSSYAVYNCKLKMMAGTFLVLYKPHQHHYGHVYDLHISILYLVMLCYYYSSKMSSTRTCLFNRMDACLICVVVSGGPDFRDSA